MKETTLHLPQISITTSYKISKEQYLLTLGGRAPADDWLKTVSSKRTIWAVDHGIDCLYKNNLLPSRLIGDCDSAEKSAWQWGEKLSIPVHRFPTEKDFTDTQLALSLLAEDSEKTAIITGAFGGRLDHAYSTIFSCANTKSSCFLADEQEILFFLKDNSHAKIQCHTQPFAVSLLPFTAECANVSINGTYWPLENALLRQPLPNAISNEIRKGDSFTVSLQKGILGIYLYFKP